MDTTYYDAGLATVANGETTITFSLGGIVDAKFRSGDSFADPAQPLVPPQRLASAPVDGVAELAVAWPGTSLVDAGYEVRFTSDGVRQSERTRQLLEQMSVVQANGRGLFYFFSDSIADADPGSGYLRLDNATIASATAAYVDNLDANGATVTGELDTWDDSSSITKGKLWLRSIADPSAFHAFNVTGAVVDGTGYRKLALTYVGGSSTFSTDDELMVFFVPTGDQGDSFNYDIAVADIAARAAYDDEAEGFVVLVLDDGAYPSRSAFYTMGGGGSADWDLTAYLTGPIGPAPNLAIGTVTTLVAGTPATAEIAGTNPDFVLNLELPEGERGITWRDEYSGAAEYALDDGVLYNGSSWRALQATTGNAPPTLPTTSNDYWRLLARRGIDGEGTGDVVGPAGAEDARIAVFDGATGKLLKDGGYTISELAVGADEIDNTKLANMDTATIKGRTSSGTGDPEDLTAAQALVLLKTVGAATTVKGSGVSAVGAGAGAVSNGTCAYNYVRVGDLVTLWAKITIIAQGTAGQNINFTAPFAGRSGRTYIGSGREDAATGTPLQVVMYGGSSMVAIFTANNQFPGASGNVLEICLTYEAA